MSKNRKKSSETEAHPSRRAFVKSAMLGAGATAALGTTGVGVGAQETNGEGITIPPEFAAAKKASLPAVDFPMIGAQVFARACHEEGVKALFCCPGNYDIVHASADTGIPSFGGRHEGSMCHAADAFCRATGEVAATSGTEGPGFTNMICAIATANAARSPILVLASNKTVFAEDSEQGIQDSYQQPTTEGLRKYGKRMITPERVWEYAGYAFRQLKSGVPKPVHLDFPAEIARARFDDASELEYFFENSKYRTETKPHPDPMAIEAAAQMLASAERPMIVSSNGVFYSRAWGALRELAEKARIPVVESGATKGQFPADHELSACAAPGALRSADVVLLVGQYCMPTLGEFAFGPDTRYIRIDPSAEDIGRNLPIDLGIVSCEKAALEALTAAMPRQRRTEWVGEVAAARKAFETENEQYYQTGIARPSCRAAMESHATRVATCARIGRGRSSTGRTSTVRSVPMSATPSAWPRRCATASAPRLAMRDIPWLQLQAMPVSASPAWRWKPCRSTGCRWSSSCTTTTPGGPGPAK